MKHLTLAILIVTALVFGACANHDTTPTTTYNSTASTTGYSK